MEGERGGPGIHLCFTGYYISGALKILDSQGLNREVALGFFFPFWAELFKARLRKPRVSARFEFRFESLKRISVLIFFICKLMIESSKYNRENYARKCFWTQERETWIKFNPGLSANQPSNNWALVLSYKMQIQDVRPQVTQVHCLFHVQVS